jgi:hypothetical protein
MEQETPVTTTEIEALESYESDGAQALTELNALMAQYGEVVVESPRLPGVPLALQRLMGACPEPPNEKNAHKHLAEAKALLSAAEAKKKLS